MIKPIENVWVVVDTRSDKVEWETMSDYKKEDSISKFVNSYKSTGYPWHVYEEMGFDCIQVNINFTEVL